MRLLVWQRVSTPVSVPGKQSQIRLKQIIGFLTFLLSMLNARYKTIGYV